MKKYCELAIYLSSLMIMFSGCSKKQEMKPNIAVDYSNTFVSEITSNESDDCYGDTLFLFVNEEVYFNLKDAYLTLSSCLQNGSFSEQLKNRGVYLSSEEASCLDKNINRCCNLMKLYKDSYEAERYDVAYEIGFELNDLYEDGLSKNYFYELLIQRKLPKKFQSPRVYEGGEIAYDWNGHILLESGWKLHTIGPMGSVITPDEQCEYFGDTVIERSKWFLELGDYLYKEYDIFNEESDSIVCYIWDVLGAERVWKREYDILKENASELYSVSAEDVFIQYENGVPYFKSFYGYCYGPLDSSSAEKYRMIEILKDAVDTRQGNPYQVERAYRSLLEEQRTYRYCR